MSRQIPVEADPPRVGPYLVDRRLGAGGMGTVYLAHHEQTGKQAAVKVLAPSLAREEGLVARFVREIDALRKLKNPHVVELYDHGVDGDMHYYAMEYVDGRDAHRPASSREADPVARSRRAVDPDLRRAQGGPRRRHHPPRS